MSLYVGSASLPSMLFVGTSLLLGHLCFTKSDLSAVFRRCFQTKGRSEAMTFDQQQRYEEDMLKTRLEMITLHNKIAIHFALIFVCSACWMLMQQQDLASFGVFVASVAVYTIHAFASQEHFSTQAHVNCLILLVFIPHVLLTLNALKETDLVRLAAAEKLCLAGVVFCSVAFMDLKASLPPHLIQTLVFAYKQCEIVGFRNVTPMMLYVSLGLNLGVGALIAFMIHAMQCCVAARGDLRDASSLMLSFQKVLHGVCDGGLVLQRPNCTIVDDASSLERLLKSNKKLCSTNFLDLFLDAESREGFLKFLEQDTGATGPTATLAIPHGLRVSLQGSSGPVSVDLFHTKIPKYSTMGSAYSLLAMREDADQSFRSTPPDAREGSTPESGLARNSENHTGSSVSDVVEAYDELVEMALLLNNQTDSLDIKEVHLSFHRPPSPPMECGMPTLRKYIRPTDWHRIETMIDIVMDLPPAELQQRCYFRHPMLFRLPGESRSYLRSRQTSITLAHQGVSTDAPTHFWMHLSSFDDTRVRRPREQDLEGIREEEAVEYTI